MKNSPNGFASLIALLVLAFLIGGGYYAYTRTQQPMQSFQTATSTAQTSDSKTSDWKTFRSDAYGIEISYPNDWIVETSGTGLEVVFLTPNARAEASDGFPGFITLTELRGEGKPADYIKSFGTMFGVDLSAVKNISVGGRNAYYYELGTDPDVQEVLFDGRQATDGSHHSYVLTKEATESDLENKYHVEDVFLQMINTIKFFPIQKSETPAGIVFPPTCQVQNLTLGSRWQIDCGPTNDARGTMGRILEPQGWKYCSHGLASQSWWKDGVLTGVSEGQANRSFELTQANMDPAPCDWSN